MIEVIVASKIKFGCTIYGNINFKVGILTTMKATGLKTNLIKVKKKKIFKNK